MSHAGQQIGKFLSQNHVKFLFTLCGGHISPVLIGAEEHGIRVIDTRHEATAVFAADATYRLSGIPGIAAVTAGPGLTNSITPLKNAQMAQSALILIGGATATMLKGRGSLQDIDQEALVKPHVKWYKAVKRVKDIIPAMETAFIKCQEGVPGPVFLELPVDLLYPEHVVRKLYVSSKAPKGIVPKIVNNYVNWHLNRLFSGKKSEIKELPLPIIKSVSPKTLTKLSKLITLAKSPLLLLGSQVALRHNMVKDLQSALDSMAIPVYTSGMARGILGQKHRLSYRHKRSQALKKADLVILAGVPMDFRLDYGRSINSRATLININLDKSTLRLNKMFRRADMKIHADPCTTLIRLSDLVTTKEYGEWIGILREREAERNNEIDEMSELITENINPIDLSKKLEKKIGPNAYMIGDGGDFISTISYIVKPRKPIHWLDPGPFGTLGSGAGFALAAKLHDPKAEVWLFYGDGSAGYTISEFDTYVRHSVNIIAIVGNDASWKQIEREQVELFNTDLGTRLTHADYHEVVSAFKGVGIKVDKGESIENVITQAISESVNKPVLINAILGETDFRKGSISM